MQTWVLLKVARMWAIPAMIFLAPFALTIFLGATSPPSNWAAVGAEAATATAPTAPARALASAAGAAGSTGAGAGAGAAVGPAAAAPSAGAALRARGVFDSPA